MRSKLRTLPIVEQWDCHSCAACCRETTIQLSPEDVARLEQQRWDRHPEFQNVKIYRRSFLLGGTPVLAHKADGSCVFLTEAGRCRVHELHGADAKPHMCRLFPFKVVVTAREALATMVRSCPSAAADRGRPLGEHIATLKRLLGESAAPDADAVSPPIVKSARRDWDDFYRVSQAIERIVVDDRLPLVRRLAHGVRFCDLLAQCKWKRVKSEAVAELIEVLVDVSERDIGALFTDRVPPSKRTARLFRRLGAHFIRCYPGGRPTRSLADQWRVMRLSGQLARGKQLLPQLHPHFPAIELETLERPLGPLSAEVLRPLNRFYEANAVSKRYAIGHADSSLVESFWRLGLTFPMALWMLRWLAAGREPTTEDMVQIVVALERGLAMSGLDRAAGYLAESGQLERLIAWYGR